jgi:hypothetical protein
LAFLLFAFPLLYIFIIYLFLHILISIFVFVLQPTVVTLTRDVLAVIMTLVSSTYAVRVESPLRTSMRTTSMTLHAITQKEIFLLQLLSHM